MKVFEKLLKGLRSRRFALQLLLGLSVLSAWGTFAGSGEGARLSPGDLGPLGPLAGFLGLTGTYRSPFFISLLGTLCLSIALCTWSRLIPRLRGKGGGSGGWARPVADLLVHGSLLMIFLGGGGKALFGFIGTQYLFLDTEVDETYDWDSQGDVPLGFTLVLRELRDEFYPARFRVGLRESASGEKIGLIEVRVGRSATLEGEDLTVEVAAFDEGAGSVTFRVRGGGEERDAAFELREGAPAVPVGPYTLSVVAWRRDLKKVRGRLAVLDGGREVKEEWLSINGSVSYGDTTVYQVGYGTDEYGNRFFGIQVSRDPAAPLFWVGVSLLGIAVPLLLFLRSRGAPAAVRAARNTGRG